MSRQSLLSSSLVLCSALLLSAGGARAQQPASPVQTDARVAVKADLEPGYAGSASCAQCHAVQTAQFGATAKGKLFLEHPANAVEKRGCEGCHGPSAKHAESGGAELGSMIAFSRKSATPIAQRNAVCLNCHERTARMFWKGSSHEARDVACTDCHTVMRTVSERGSLRKESVLETCGTCHQQRKSQQVRYSHMPLGQGKMECTNCHNPHGSANEKLLVASSVNEVCYSCHTEKRGPFLWQHAPVSESCSNCHDAHGSSHEKMLKVPRPRLCQQCHAATGHPQTPRTPGVAADVPFVLNRQCSNCHINIHGSNHPAGAFFTR
jgi:DmsE family decaheme c-type cytochrome